MSTIFKRIIDREIKARIVYEDDLCLAFHDVAPQAPHHVLLIPKKEIRTLNEVSDQDQHLLGHMMVQVPKIAATLGFGPQGYRVVINCGDGGGQTVFHLHVHIIGGRKLSWPPG